MLCDLFVAEHVVAMAYEECILTESEARQEIYAPREFKRLSALEFGTLWAIIDAVSWDVKRHQLDNLAFGEEYESWLYQFPTDYVTSLSQLHSASLPAIAQTWSETEELQCDAEGLLPVIEALVELAHEAKARGLGLYMWGSL